MLFTYFNKHFHMHNDDDGGGKRIVSKNRLAIQKALSILEQEGDANEENKTSTNDFIYNDFIDGQMKTLRRHRGSFSISRSFQRALKLKQKIHATGNTKSKDGARHIHVTHSVHFSNQVQFINIPHINDIPQKEIDKCWMKEEDYSFIRSETLRLVRMMEQSKLYPIKADTNTMNVNGHEICIRGLETSQYEYESVQLQRKLYTSLFSLQTKLKEEGLVDPQAIRKVCEKHSKKSSKTARLVGISDEVNASVRPGIPYNSVIPPLRKQTVTSSAA